jgi:putative Mg2+ transporter-C (MgtC) family protein
MPWFDWTHTEGELVKLVIAYTLALPVGWYREKVEHNVGLRTFPLVAMASCGYVLLGVTSGPHVADVQSRIIQGLLAGVGFIGGGAIVRSGESVHGTATAASIWTTGVLGAAVALERFPIAIALAVLNLVALRLLSPLKQRLDSPNGGAHGGTGNGASTASASTGDATE